MAYSEKTKNNEQKASRPIDEVRFGSCKVVVCKNETKNGQMLNFTIARLYKEGSSGSRVGRWRLRGAQA